MIRPALISLLLASPVAADPSVTINAALDRYQRVCTPAMSDPQKFVDEVPTWAPAGTYKAGTTADGKMYKMNIAAGDFFDTLSVSVHRDEQSTSCTVHYSGMGIPDGFAAAAAFEALIAQRLPADALSGGHFPEFYAEPGSDILQVNDRDHQFLVSDLLPGLEMTTFVQIIDQWMSISAHHVTRRTQ